jgi:HAD superfamily hydrolase (TIGR01509 family)
MMPALPLCIMTPRAILLDIDGTLVDTNEAHVSAWRLAFAEFNYRVGHDRIAEEIGKGGDHLVPDVLGRDVEHLHGDALRAGHKKAFRARIERDGASFFPGVASFLDALRARGLRTAIATSASRDELVLLEKHLGRTFASMVDKVATGDDAATSKPAPHIVEVACTMLGEDPLACAMLGDSVHDSAAARAAGVAFLGVTSGFADEADLRAAGARFIARDLGHLTASLARALSAASPGHITFSRAVIAALTSQAIDAARAGMAEGEVPIGAALFNGDGALMATGHSRACKTGDVTAHAEIDAFRRLATTGRDLGDGAILVSTLEPCVMCLGAAMEVGIDVVIYSLEAPADGGTSRIHAPRSPENKLPRMRGGSCREEARDLFIDWLRRSPESSRRPHVEQLLAETDRARKSG